MASDRRPFEEKYKDIHIRLNVEKELTAYIIRRYSKKLEEELHNLKTDNLRLPPHFKDRRTDEEYIFDLVDGWLIEDVICDVWLRQSVQKINSEVHIKPMGTDRDRTLQKTQFEKITTHPDFIYSVKGKDRFIELQMAREARPNKGYDMKESKVTRAIRDNTLFLWVIIPGSQYFIINPAEFFQNIQPKKNILWGGKLVYTIEPEQVNNVGLENMSEGIHEKYHKILGLI